MHCTHRILVTRPLEFVEGLCQGIVALGSTPLLFPTIHIMPTLHKRSLKAVIKTLESNNILIFVSRSAVHFSMPMIQAIWATMPPLTWCAIGPGTAEALQNFHLSPIISPEVPPYESESLLKLEELQQQKVAGRRVIIFRGSTGRDLLINVLRERGAFVQTVESYQRSLPVVNMVEQWSMWQKTPIDTIVSTSTEGMSNLLSLIEQEPVLRTVVSEWIKTIPIIVVSNRMLEAAKKLGFKKPVLALSAEDAALIQAIKEIREGRL